MTIDLVWMVMALVAFVTYYLVLRKASAGRISRMKSTLWSVLMVVGALSFSFGMMWLARLAYSA